MKRICLSALVAISVIFATPPRATSQSAPPTGEWIKLFTQSGPVGKGWTVRAWYDVSEQPERPVTWNVRDGILYGSGESNKTDGGDWVGTWLMSEQTFGDFILELDFSFKKGGLRGNGGVALRAPMAGDPAYDGMEIQITDERYEQALHKNILPSQLTGSIYLVSAPLQSAYRHDAWNRYRFELRSSRVKIWLNDKVVQDVDMQTLTQPALRHDADDKLVPAKSGAQRPLHGHIGIQDLSANGEAIMIANARIMPLN